MKRPQVASQSTESVERVAYPSRTDGRTDGLTKKRLTNRTSGTFRNARTRMPEISTVGGQA